YDQQGVARGAGVGSASLVLREDAVAVVVSGGAARVRVRGGGEVVRGGGPCGPGAAAVAAVLVLQVVGDARAVAVGGGPGDGSGAVTAYRCGRGGWRVRAADRPDPWGHGVLADAGFVHGRDSELVVVAAEEVEDLAPAVLVDGQ